MRVLITGSSSGIGRALAERLLAGQHEVWGFARSNQSQFVVQHPGRFHPVCCDVADGAKVIAAVASVTSATPWIEAVVTCAAVHGAIGRAMQVDPKVWSDSIRTNLDGTFFILRAIWPALLRAPQRAKVVCFSGGGATKARPGFSAYGAAKTAVVRLVETIAEEERTAPVDINAIAPGAVATRLTDEIVSAGPQRVGDDEYRSAQHIASTGDAPLNRALQCVDWLLSPASDGISGKLISAPWDPWSRLPELRADLTGDIYTLRRIGPKDRGKTWGAQ